MIGASGWSLGVAASLLAATGVAAAAAPAAKPVYAITRVGSSLGDDEVVGAKRAGLACLPNGAIRWGDVATGGTMDQREIVQDAAEDAGLPVTPLGMIRDGGARSVLNLRGAIRAASFSLCARGWGFGGIGGVGDRARMSGDATLSVEWRVEDQAGGGAATYVSHSAAHLDAHHAASLGAIYRGLLADAARDVTRRLLAGSQ